MSQNEEIQKGLAQTDQTLSNIEQIEGNLGAKTYFLLGCFFFSNK